MSRYADPNRVDLLPDSVRATLPPLYAQDGAGDDAVCFVKLFTPDSSWTWYVLEFDPKEELVFSLANGHEVEYGYTALIDLEMTRGPLGLHIERDLWWTPTSIGEIRAAIREGRPL